MTDDMWLFAIAFILGYAGGTLHALFDMERHILRIMKNQIVKSAKKIIKEAQREQAKESENG